MNKIDPPEVNNKAPGLNWIMSEFVLTMSHLGKLWNLAEIAADLDASKLDIN